MQGWTPSQHPRKVALPGLCSEERKTHAVSTAERRPEEEAGEREGLEDAKANLCTQHAWTLRFFQQGQPRQLQGRGLACGTLDPHPGALQAE